MIGTTIGWAFLLYPPKLCDKSTMAQDFFTGFGRSFTCHFTHGRFEEITGAAFLLLAAIHCARTCHKIHILKALGTSGTNHLLPELMLQCHTGICRRLIIISRNQLPTYCYRSRTGNLMASFLIFRVPARRCCAVATKTSHGIMLWRIHTKGLPKTKNLHGYEQSASVAKAIDSCQLKLMQPFFGYLHYT